MNPTSINLTYNHTAPDTGWTVVDTATGPLTPQTVILTVTVTVTQYHAAALAFVTVRGTDEAGDVVVATLHTTPTMPDCPHRRHQPVEHPHPAGDLSSMTATDHDDITVNLDDLAPLLDALDQIALKKADLAEAERTLTEQVKAALGDRGTAGTVGGKTRVTWREHTRRTIDQKALRADFPEIAEKLEKVSTVRVFKIGGR